MCDKTAFETIARAVKRVHNDSAPCIVGISGMDAAGKTCFTDILKAQLAGEYKVGIVHLDNFFYPTSIRYKGIDEVDNFLNRSIDFDQFEQCILVPLKEERKLNWNSHLYDLGSDQYSYHANFDIGPGDIAIVEGVFLFRESWRRYFDLRIFLKTTNDVLLSRGLKRDALRLGIDVQRRYEEKYFPAHLRHSIIDEPERYAHFIVDNNNFNRPTILVSRTNSNFD